MKTRGCRVSVLRVQDPKVEAYIRMIVGWSIKIAAQKQVADALGRVEHAAMMRYKQSLRLLALRRYLRKQDIDHVDLHKVWTWGEGQVRESMHSGIGLDLMIEAKRVQDSFARSNPGYTLSVSPPRSLARQVNLWVTSGSARSASDKLLDMTIQHLDKPEFELPPRASKVQSVAAWLRDRPIHPEPGNAAPGTSDHGQVKAVDFVVVQGSQMIAGTSTATIATKWTAPGWAERLAAAVKGTRLKGPLAHPYEPWHWSL